MKHNKLLIKTGIAQEFYGAVYMYYNDNAFVAIYLVLQAMAFYLRIPYFLFILYSNTSNSI